MKEDRKIVRMTENMRLLYTNLKARANKCGLSKRQSVISAIPL